jgi:hypothetical protein
MSNLTIAGALGAVPLTSGPGRTKRLILRSSWQTVNIGDTAHTPGVLAILEKYFPDLEVILWPSSVADGVQEMLLERFPRLRILTKMEREQSFPKADFFLHGSGPSLIGRHQIERWRKETGKPYGVYGITFKREERIEPFLDDAAFVYFRDTPSLEFAQEHGCTSPVMGFCPDGAFACDLEDDAGARAYLSANGLHPGKFLCCIPRYRRTPYWRIKPWVEYNQRHDDRNHAMKEQDHAPLREAIIRVARETDYKILVCPEDQTQVELGKEMLVDPLPVDVRSKVVHRDTFWKVDLAGSVYNLSAGLFGLEMHSPILCIGRGVPAIVGRFKEQTTKGFMWKDIGLPEWLFDFDDPEQVARYADTVLSLVNNREAAVRKAREARRRVEQLQAETMAVLKQSLG